MSPADRPRPGAEGAATPPAPAPDERRPGAGEDALGGFTCLYGCGPLTAQDRREIAHFRTFLQACEERRPWRVDEDLAMVQAGGGWIERVQLHPEYGDRGNGTVVVRYVESEERGGPTWNVRLRDDILGPWDERYRPYTSAAQLDAQQHPERPRP